MGMVDPLEPLVWQAIVIFLRVGALVSVVPAFGERSVPIRIKLAAAIAFTLIVAPAVHSVPLDQRIGWLAISEAIIGLALGLGLRMFILALQTAGAIAAQSTSLSQLLGGAVADPVAAMGHVLVIGALALATIAGLHIQIAKLILFSYDIIPIGTVPSGNIVAAWGLDQVRQAFGLAFSLAAPFVIFSVLYNLALGAINKAMPQLMVAFVGAPVVTAAGLILLALAAPAMLSAWLDALNNFLLHPFQVAP